MLLQSLSSLIGNYNLYKFICRWMKLKYTIHQEHRYFTHPSYPVFAVVTYQNQLYVQNVFWNVWIFSRRTVLFAVLQESLPTTSLTVTELEIWKWPCLRSCSLSPKHWEMDGRPSMTDWSVPNTEEHLPFIFPMLSPMVTRANLVLSLDIFFYFCFSFLQ